MGRTNYKRGGRAHLIGISGVGMGALAGLLHQCGLKVQGSDAAFYPPIGPFLKGLGIRLFKGYSPQNLSPPPDFVVIGNAIRADNKEAVAALSLNIPCYSFPDALRRFFLRERDVVCVCGTHGKTTTTALAVSALKGYCPGFMVGGILKGVDKGFNIGRPPWFVVEGDEYDTAFFEKTPKFLHYGAKHAIITGIEFDHADIYSDIGEIKDAFSQFILSLPDDGVIAACADSPELIDVISRLKDKDKDEDKNEDCDGIEGGIKADIVYYGISSSAQYRLLDCSFSEGHTSVRCLTPMGELSYGLPLIGRHNAVNSLGVIALFTELGLRASEIINGLSEAKGVKRRQEVAACHCGADRGKIRVIDDFAHHPTAVKETIMAVRDSYNPERLIAIFEPRTNTSRRRIFQKDYVSALLLSDVVIVRQTPNPEKAPPDDRFSSKKLADDIRGAGGEAHLAKDGMDALEIVKGLFIRQGDIILVMSNGDFDGIIPMLIDYVNAM